MPEINIGPNDSPEEIKRKVAEAFRPVRDAMKAVDLVMEELYQHGMAEAHGGEPPIPRTPEERLRTAIDLLYGAECLLAGFKDLELLKDTLSVARLRIVDYGGLA